MSDFDGLNALLGTSYVETSGTNGRLEIQVLEMKKNEIVEKMGTIKTLKDQEYIEKSLKELFEESQTAFRILLRDLKIGANARDHEVAAKWLDSLTNLLKELKEFNKLVADMEFFNLGSQPPQQNQEKLSLTSSQIVDMIEAVKKNSEINKIDGTFEIID